MINEGYILRSGIFRLNSSDKPAGDFCRVPKMPTLGFRNRLVSCHPLSSSLLSGPYRQSLFTIPGSGGLDRAEVEFVLDLTENDGASSLFASWFGTSVLLMPFGV